MIDAGALLIEAKAVLSHGDSRAMVDAELPFGARTAQRLMVIAGDPGIADRTHGSDLPPSWRTLYELTRPRLNHFTILGDFADRESPLTQAVLAQMGPLA